MSELEHYDNEIYAIEERISRLSIACGVNLANDLHVAAIREGNLSICARGDEHSRHLLRELVLLRDYIAIHCADELGLAKCRKILVDVDARLRHNGLE